MFKVAVNVQGSIIAVVQGTFTAIILLSLAIPVHSYNVSLYYLTNSGVSPAFFKLISRQRDSRIRRLLTIISHGQSAKFGVGLEP